MRKINFGKIWISKIAILTILETLNFEFCWIWNLKNGSNWLKLKCRPSKSAKNDIFHHLSSLKFDFRPNLSSRQIVKISTTCCLNFTFWKCLEHSAQLMSIFINEELPKYYFFQFHILVILWLNFVKIVTFGTPSISYRVPIISIISGSSIDPLPSLSYILKAHLKWNCKPFWIIEKYNESKPKYSKRSRIIHILELWFTFQH